MKASELLLDFGFEDVVIFSDYGYDDALIGVTTDNRAVYDFDKMVRWLVENHDFSPDDAYEWIEYNTIRSLSYSGNTAPIVIYPLSYE